MPTWGGISCCEPLHQTHHWVKVVGYSIAGEEDDVPGQDLGDAGQVELEVPGALPAGQVAQLRVDAIHRPEGAQGVPHVPVGGDVVAAQGGLPHLQGCHGVIEGEETNLAIGVDVGKAVPNIAHAEVEPGLTRVWGREVS